MINRVRSGVELPSKWFHLQTGYSPLHSLQKDRQRVDSSAKSMLNFPQRKAVHRQCSRELLEHSSIQDLFPIVPAHPHLHRDYYHLSNWLNRLSWCFKSWRIRLRNSFLISNRCGLQRNRRTPTTSLQQSNQDDRH